MKAVFIFILIVLYLPGEYLFGQAQNSLKNDHWIVEYDETGINGLLSVYDSYEANLIRVGSILDTDVRFRLNDGEWQSVLKRLSGFFRPLDTEPTSSRKVESDQNILTYTDYKPGMPFSLEQRFTLLDDVLEWDIQLKNRMNHEVEIGDLAISIPSRTTSGKTQTDLFERNFTRSHFISGNGSFIIYTRRSGKAPYLIVTVKPGTHLEYFTSEGSNPFKAFIHSALSGERQDLGTWRQPHTRQKLELPGLDGDQLTYGFRLQWAGSYDDLRNILYENELIDVRVVPGMTIPEDQSAQFSLHTKADIDSVLAEFPDQTAITYRGELKPDHHVYEVQFTKLGENKVTVYFGENRKTQLEFFVTEPIQTLLEKRAAFITENQQHRDSSLWYDGLYSIWDMKNQVLRGPDNTDGYEGWWGYMLASDDPVLGIAPFLASVNALNPRKNQIESLEYHIENFVWGGLQRTNEEDPYPYGIHGIPNFKVARDTLERAKIENRRLDRMKIWRAYDYPLVFMLYYHMYQIAERYPDSVEYHDADGYFDRMWYTVEAFFNYPYEIYPWYDIYKWGYYNEMLIPEIITLLEEKERFEDAKWLRNEWEKKVLYFVYSDPYPYRSEYPYDRTAFESTYALAKYGATHAIAAGDSLWYDKNEDIWHSYDQVDQEEARKFMDRQHLAGLAVRGWLEPKYFLMGSDFTTNPDNHTLSYMARMGGWSILDYGLHFSDEPHDWLQLGYASYLSSFALMNTGREETNYGFWFPGKQNDGALGMAFMSAKHDRAWIQKNENRGAWRYDAEQNLGMAVVTRSASTILSNDPLFGWITYGGNLEENEDGFKISPVDGVGLRFWVINDSLRVGAELDRDSWAYVFVSRELDEIELILETSADPHNTKLTLHKYGDEEWGVYQNGQPASIQSQGRRDSYILNVSESQHKITIKKR